MIDYVFSLILLAIALVSIELRKSYHQVPKNELRYRARNGDLLADKIYKAVAYEDSLEVLLWFVIVLCLAGSLVIFNGVAPLWLDFLAIVIFLAAAFVWLPRVRATGWSEKLVIYLTPSILWLLNYLQPLLQKLLRHQSAAAAKTHTELYDKSDLVDLVNRQKQQGDNRIREADLELIKKALKLSDKTVGQYARPWSKLAHITIDEALGPVLLDELHKSGQLFVPVTKEADSLEVVGLIDLGRIDLSTTGQVRDHLNQNLLYLNEDDSLEEALGAMAASGQPVFLVLDKKNTLYGLITLSEVLAQLINTPKSLRDYTKPTKIKDTEEDAPDSLTSA